MIKKLTGLFFLFFSLIHVNAQEFNSWNVFPSFSTVGSITNSEDLLFAATLGGIYTVSQDNILRTYTTMDGLYRSDPTSIIYDNQQNQLFVGYIDGTIDVINLDNDEIEPLEDISRVSRFNTKRINSFRIYEDELYVATSFGIVIYDLESLLVTDSYLKLGDFDIGTPVVDFDISRDSIFTATTQGIATGDLSLNLVESSNWENYSEADGLPSNVIDDVLYYQSNIYSIVEGVVYSNENIGWTLHPDFPQSGNHSLERNENESSFGSATDTEIKIMRANGEVATLAPSMESSINSFSLVDDEIQVGTSNEGILVYSDINGSSTQYLPSGPYLNFFSNTMIDGNTLLATSTIEFPGIDTFNPIRGYYIYDDGTWINYNRNTRSELGGVQTIYSLGQTDEDYFIGSWGYGIIKHSKENAEIVRYHRNNSNLEGVSSSPNYIVISGLDNDSQNNMWAVSYRSEFPLNVQMNGSEEWIRFEPLSGSDNYYNLFIDSFDHKWISLITSSAAGLGLLVIDTGNPEDPNDDTTVKLTSNSANGNLPDDKVNVILEDKNGEVWIGTNRGIARFIFPELIVDGGPQERQAQWLINEDTSAVSRFLLRDVDVTSMAVNAANEKWIGSRNQGIWVLNDEGSRIERRFTVENSQLISNNVLSISVNDVTGEVFIATDLGLVSYMDIPKAPVNEMNELKVYPNPFQYDRHNQIVIEGLSESTNIKILGVDGFVVHEIQTQGGRISWDGYDYNGNRLGTGVYYIVAYEDSGRESGLGKVIIVK